ncbi:hypothetical protein AYO45_06840 [Gammaproteobacteria bacterium SCGC AG-212-F23]|nr:hypothetical protein AYO45_06840 [Gammaproteobacteria bacterium SCGC AG-212-F23]
MQSYALPTVSRDKRKTYPPHKNGLPTIPSVDNKIKVQSARSAVPAESAVKPKSDKLNAPAINLSGHNSSSHRFVREQLHAQSVTQQESNSQSSTPATSATNSPVKTADHKLATLSVNTVLPSLDLHLSSLHAAINALEYSRVVALLKQNPNYKGILGKDDACSLSVKKYTQVKNTKNAAVAGQIKDHILQMALLDAIRQLDEKYVEVLLKANAPCYIKSEASQLAVQQCCQYNEGENYEKALSIKNMILVHAYGIENTSCTPHVTFIESLALIGQSKKLVPTEDLEQAANDALSRQRVKKK